MDMDIKLQPGSRKAIMKDGDLIYWNERRQALRDELIRDRENILARAEAYRKAHEGQPEDPAEDKRSAEVQPMKEETIKRILRFSEDRDWGQFHTPANLAKSISIEANELLECFQWNEEEYDLEAVKDELADVIVYCVDMLNRLGLDADEIVNAKMTKNEAKYPVEKARGKAAKYTEL